MQVFIIIIIIIIIIIFIIIIIIIIIIILKLYQVLFIYTKNQDNMMMYARVGACQKPD